MSHHCSRKKKLFILELQHGLWKWMGEHGRLPIFISIVQKFNRVWAEKKAIRGLRRGDKETTWTEKVKTLKVDAVRKRTWERRSLTNTNFVANWSEGSCWEKRCSYRALKRTLNVRATGEKSTKKKFQNFFSQRFSGLSPHHGIRCFRFRPHSTFLAWGASGYNLVSCH